MLWPVLIAAWLAFPVVLLALTLGCGLLVERVAGDRLPGALLLPSGLALVIVAAELMTSTSGTAKLATGAVIVLAVAGFALSWERFRRLEIFRSLDRWAVACALGVFACYAAPVAFSGEPTVAGYMKLEDTADWLGITEQVMHHGRDLSNLAPSSYEYILRVLGTDYPVGAFLPWGVARPLVGQDLAWLLQPYIAFVGAVLALGLYALAAPIVSSRPLRAFVALIASQPAVLFGFALWGAIKEIVAISLLALVAALIPFLLRGEISPRRLVPIAVASAAVLASLSIGGLIWLAPLLLPTAWLVYQNRGRREAVRGAVAFLVIAAVASIPTLALAGSFIDKSSTAFTGGDLGNLIDPLSFMQLFGIWPVGDFRLRPDSMVVPGFLIAVVVATGVAGVAAAWERRAWGLVTFSASAVVGFVFVQITGSPWIVSKALAEAAPAFVLMGLVGAVALLSETELARRQRVGLSAFALVAIGVGVLWSNVLAYRNVDLAPHDRFAELETVGKRVSGKGPTLTTEYEFWGTRHFLRNGQPDGANQLSRRVMLLRPGVAFKRAQSSPTSKGLTVSVNAGPPQEPFFYDIDDFQLQTLLPFRSLVLRRSPVASRPPGPYKLAWQGRYYELWQRQPGPLPPVEHLSIGGDSDPAAVPSCDKVLGLARLARGGQIAAVTRPAPVLLPLSRASFSSSDWQRTPDPAELYPRGDGTLESTVTVPEGGNYGLWLGGSFRGSVDAFVDGRRVGSRRGELNYSERQYNPLGSVSLSPGRHRVELRYDSSSLRPGTKGNAILPLFSEEVNGESKKARHPYAVGPLVLARGTANQRVTYLPAGQARRLCGQRLDWVEAINVSGAGSGATSALGESAAP